MMLAKQKIRRLFSIYVGREPNLDEWLFCETVASEVELERYLAESDVHSTHFKHLFPFSSRLKTYAINCKADTVRLERLKLAWDNDSRFDFEVVEGIDARLSSFLEQHQVSSPLPAGISLNTVGCFLSHRKVWEKVLSGKEDFGLIIEDDAVLASPDSVLGMLPVFKHDFDVIFVNQRTSAYCAGVASFPHKHFLGMGEVYRSLRLKYGDGFATKGAGGDLWACGGDGYILSKSGAEKLLAHDCMVAATFHVDHYLMYRSLSFFDVSGQKNFNEVQILMDLHGIEFMNLTSYVATIPMVSSGRLPSVRRKF